MNNNNTKNAPQAPLVGRLSGSVIKRKALFAGLLVLLLSCSIKIKKSYKIKPMKKTEKKVKRQYKDTFKPTGSKNSGVTDTVAGESYTIQELFDKHTTGTMPHIGLDPQYDYEEATHDDSTLLRKPDLDLTDIEQISNEVKTTNQKIKKQKQTKHEAEQKAKKDKERAQYKQEILDDLAKSKGESSETTK